MVDKLNEYEGTVGRLHRIRENIKENVSTWRENHVNLNKKIVDNVLRRHSRTPAEVPEEINFNFSHINRRKTRWELIRLCAVVMGIEFAYAAITAFSSPILLEIGVPQNLASLVFSLSPILGFFLSPITGSLSDNCTFRHGRRRIFMMGYALFEVLGLLVLPYGSSYNEEGANDLESALANQTVLSLSNSSDIEKNETSAVYSEPKQINVPPLVLAITVVAIVLSDFCADGLQNPSRAYLLDVCPEEDHTRGLSMFTVLAGFGGTIGYYLGSVDWDNFALGQMMGGHTKTVFYLMAIIFTASVALTVTTFSEVPLKVLQQIQLNNKLSSLDTEHSMLRARHEGAEEKPMNEPGFENIKLQNIGDKNTHNCQVESPEVKEDLLERMDSLRENDTRRKSSIAPSKLASNVDKEEMPTLSEYLSSIVRLPYSMKILLLTNVFCWMSHVSYSLFFSDYVGEEIFGGDPKAPLHSDSRNAYEEGIRFACLGMMVYSFSCLMCSLILEKVIDKFGIRAVYITNLVIDAASMFLMFNLNNKFAVIVFSFASGIIYCTLFTIPYIIVARYHTLNVFEVDSEGNFITSQQVRGLGTDVSIIGSSVFIAQFFLSMGMGSIVKLYGSTAAVPLLCSLLSLCAACTATKVIYLDL